MRIPKVRQNAFLSPVQHNKGNPNKKPPKLMSLKRDIAVYHIMGKDERHNPVGKLVLQVFNPENPKEGKAACKAAFLCLFSDGDYYFPGQLSTSFAARIWNSEW